MEPIRQTGQYDILGDRVYFPINHNLVRDLLGRLLTQLDAMALPDRAHKAAKSLLVREVWRWWSWCAENSTTSGLGCVAPVVMTEDYVPKDDVTAAQRPPSNRWGWKSEQEWLAAQEPSTETRVLWTQVSS
jgi:hypothetical protein